MINSSCAPPGFIRVVSCTLNSMCTIPKNSSTEESFDISGANPETREDLTEIAAALETIASPEPGVRAKKPHPFRALNHPNFRLFWGSQLISLIGSWMQNLAQGWLIVLLVDPVGYALLRHGGAAVEGNAHRMDPAVEAQANLYSGYVNFAGGLPIFLLTLFAGVLADRVSKRKLLTVTQTVFALCAFSLGMLCVTGRIEIWQVLLVSFVSGIALALDMPSRQAFVVELVGREDLPSAIALNSSIFNAARAIGPAIAGILIASHISIGANFLGNALFTVAPIIALLCLKVPERKEERPSADVKTVLSHMMEGFRYVKSNQSVKNLIILVGTFGMFAFSFNVLIPVFIRFILLPHATDAFQARAFGYMETDRGIGAFCGAMVVAALGNPRTQRQMLLWGSLSATVILVFFALARTLWVADLLMALVSCAFVICFATSNTLVQLTCPDALRGRVISIYTLMFIGTGPFGSLLAGWSAGHIGPTETMLIFALISLITVAALTLKRGGLRELEIPEPRPAF